MIINKEDYAKYGLDDAISPIPKQTSNPPITSLSSSDAYKNDYVGYSGFSLGSLSSWLLSGTTLPYGLSRDKSVAIKVYSTKDADYVFSGLVSGTKKAADKQKSFFGGLEKAINAVETSVNSVVNSITSAISGKPNISQNSSSPFNVSGSVFGNLPKDFGNPRLARHWEATYYLPIPNMLAESMSNNYEENPGWINDFGNAALTGVGLLPGVGDSLKSGIKAGVDIATKATATMAKMTGSRKIKAYENKLQMFNSQAFREISLSWDFVPNSEPEARDIQELVRSLKSYGSPESLSGRLLVKAPNFFGLEFHNKVLNDALRFDEVVLVSLSVDYVNGGNMELYEDGMPKHITLNMTFRDRQPKLRDDWYTTPQYNQSSDEKKCG
jgi:hypothetical protein